MATAGVRMGCAVLALLCAGGCGGSATRVHAAGIRNDGIDRAMLGLHLAHVAEIVEAQCPERSLEAIGAAYDRRDGRLATCRDATAYDHARSWLDVLASESTEDEARLWAAQREELIRSFVGAGVACETADPEALRAALERATRLHAARDTCESCGPMQREMLTAVAREVLRRARMRAWSRREDLRLVQGMRVFSMMRGPVQLPEMFELVSEHAPECEVVEVGTQWAARETWMEGTLLGSSATVMGPPILFTPQPLGFEGAVFAVYAARTSLEGVRATLAPHFRPADWGDAVPSGEALWFEGLDGNSAALVLPGGRDQRSADHLVILAMVSPEHEDAELVAGGVLEMLESATRPSDAPALPGAPMVLDDPSLPWLAHLHILLDMWVYTADPLVPFVPGQATEGVTVMRAAAQPPCEVPSEFVGTAEETNVFGVGSCAMFTQRASAPEGPWTHTLVIPQPDGALVIAQNIAGDHDTALARARARIPLMRLATP
jgi:hypothetical protein